MKNILFIILAFICSHACGQLANNNLLFDWRPELGFVYNKASWTNMSDFVNNLSATVVSNEISVSGGSPNGVPRVAYNYISALEKSKFNIKLKVNAQLSISGAYGPGIALVSNNGWTNNQYSICVQYMNSTSDNNAIRIITTSNNGGTWTERSRVSMPVTLAAGDVIYLELVRTHNAFTATARNITQNSSSVSCSYTYSLGPVVGGVAMPNTFQYSFLNFLTGTTSNLRIQEWQIYSTIRKYPQVLFTGDSKTTGYSAVVTTARYAELFAAGSVYAVEAGGSTRTAELLTLIPEITAIQPNKVLLNIGRNDLASGVAQATWEANYASIVSQLQSAGITVKHLLPITPDSQSQTLLSTYINANYSSSDIISGTMAGGSGSVSSDGIHPNAAGHIDIYNNIVSSGNL